MEIVKLRFVHFRMLSDIVPKSLHSLQLAPVVAWFSSGCWLYLQARWIVEDTWAAWELCYLDYRCHGQPVHLPTLQAHRQEREERAKDPGQNGRISPIQQHGENTLSVVMLRSDWQMVLRFFIPQSHGV